MAFSFLDQICKLTWAHGDAEATGNGNGNSNGCSITATNSEAEMRKSFRAHLAQSPTVRPVPVTCYPLFAAADSAAGFRSTTSASAEESFPEHGCGAPEIFRGAQDTASARWHGHGRFAAPDTGATTYPVRGGGGVRGGAHAESTPHPSLTGRAIPPRRVRRPTARGRQLNYVRAAGPTTAAESPRRRSVAGRSPADCFLRDPDCRRRKS